MISIAAVVVGGIGVVVVGGAVVVVRGGRVPRKCIKELSVSKIEQKDHRTWEVHLEMC